MLILILVEHIYCTHIADSTMFNDPQLLLFLTLGWQRLRCI